MTFSFSLAAALQALYLAYSAYCDEPLLTSWTCMYCAPGAANATVSSDSFTGGYGFVTFNKSEDVIIVSFRGSADVQNWIANVDAAQAWPFPQLPNVAVHAGFYQVYASVVAGLLQGVFGAQKACPRCRKLLVTGHSLGGALATMGAFEWSELFRNQLEVSLVTFGSPRLGNPAFEREFRRRPIRRHWRVVHNADIVPHVPQQWQFPYWTVFSHVETEVWFNQNSTDFTICNGPEDPTCSDSVAIWDTSIDDHNDYLGVQKQHCVARSN